MEQSIAVAQTAMDLLKLYHDAILPQAETNLQVTLRAYEDGKQSITAMIEAKKFYINQRLAEVTVHRDLAVAIATLERALGGRLPDAGAAKPATTQPTSMN